MASKDVKNLKREKALLVMLLSFLIGLSPLCVQKTNAYPGARIYTVPSTLNFTVANGTLGTRFNITFWIENVTTPALDGWQLEMHFDDTNINVTSDANDIRAWPSVLRGINKFDTRYVFYDAASVGSSILVPTAGHVGPKNGYVLIADAIIIGDPWNASTPGLLGIIEFNITSAPADGLVGTFDITNEWSWIKPDSVNVTATFEDGHFVPEFPSLLLTVFFASLTLVAVVFRKKLR